MQLPNRRQFLASSAAVAGVALGVSVGVGEDQPTAPVIDTHTHFYDPERPEGVPWPAKGGDLYRRVLPQEFETLVKPFGITGTVIVEASPWVEDNQWLLDLAKDDPFLVGVVGNLKVGDAEFAKHLRRFAKNPRFRGIRISHADAAAAVKQHEFLDNLRRLIDLDLELDINGGPESLVDVARLADKLNNLRMVINHAANAKIDGKPVSKAWLAGMQAAAMHEYVFCKVSALTDAARDTEGKVPAELAFYKPELDALWEVWGEDRLVYGSNWPVSEQYAPYSVGLGIVRDYFATKGRVASEKFFGLNSKVAYTWVSG